MREDEKTISRSSFLGSLGTLGLLGSLPFLASACKEPKAKPTIYDGNSEDSIIDNILTRRSIRKYTDQDIPQEVLDTILKCGIFAPSAVNSQPWELRVIQNPKIIAEISKRHTDYLRIEKKEIKDPENHSINYHAPVLIIIAKAIKGTGTLPTLLDCGLLLQNIMLAAHANNLGSCPLGGIVPFLNLDNNSDLLHLFNIPSDYEIAITLALGYPDENPQAPIRYTDKVKYIR
ncbi:nitroreductase family protein [Flavobacterium gelatinilyticum]|uniref:nitroreductase family protein n=1 Tax=Flavobacterium gelatinilyticum TaxID=3003260 RepID=UPI002480949F|nr:nitroreductase [Flavobacterium gelatinilyticum]